MGYLTRLIIAGVFIVLFSFIGNAVYKKANLFVGHQFQKNEQLFNGHISADILLIGSSRVYNTINPKILEDSLKLEVYNAGMPAANIREELLILRAFLSRNRQPKMVVLGLDLFSMDAKHPFGFYASYLYNLNNRFVNDEMKRDKVKVGLYKLVPFFVMTEFDDYYRGNTIKAVRGQTELRKGDYIYKGYQSNSGNEIQSNVELPHQTNITIGQNGIDSLHTFVEICKQKGIQLIFAYSPEFKSMHIESTQNANDIFTTYSDIARQNNIPFLRNDCLEMCSDRKYFANIGHLNRFGADIYSAILAQQLKMLTK